MRLLTLAFILFTSFTFAQVTDDFTDGDFTANPSWAGDATEFIVNASNELQLNNSIAGASYLSTANTMASLNNTEWHFYIKLAFAPSSSNYGRVYLVSDQTNLEGPLNGYYLQFGEAGSLDAVELFKQTGVSSASVCRGTNGTIAASFAIGVKVTRNASGLWSLFVDPTGGTAYTLQNTGTDATYNTTNFFGVSTVYTVSNATKFYYDDFYVGPIIVDVTPPAISSLTVITNTQLDVLYNEAVDLTTCQNISNYSANNGLGTPSSAVRDATNLALVHLTFATAFTNALTNTLTVTNVQDLSGNAITTANSNFTYFAPVVAAFKDIIINEIFADPTPQVGLPLFEFVELYNRSTNTINLNGFNFTDGTSTATLGSYNLSPNQYLIVCAIADTASFTPYGPTMGVSSWPSLNNSGDNLKLKNSSLVVIDSVNYLDTWYQDAVKKAGGWTLELINPNAAAGCPATGNWIASNNVSGGTPATVNSVYNTTPDVTAPTLISANALNSTTITVCFNEGLDVTQATTLSNYSINNGIGTPTAAIINSSLTCVDLTVSVPMTSATSYTLTVTGISDCSGNSIGSANINYTYYTVSSAGYKDVIINEIFADPSPQIGLPTGEFVELYNKSTTNAYNLNGWKFTDGSSTATLGNYVLTPNSYLIICPTADAVTYSIYGPTMGVASFPSLNNSSDNLKLQDNLLLIIDSVNYSDTWYQDAVKKDGGYTLELINPNKPVACPQNGNWIASNNANGGTPAAINSVYNTTPDIFPPSVLTAVATDSGHITICFSEAIDGAILSNVNNYSIDNGIGTPLSAVPNATLTCVELTSSTILSLATFYNVTISNISDCSGNAMATTIVPFSYYKAKPYDVVINEIMADPDPIYSSLPNYEYVELYNRTPYSINLNGWKFTAGTNTKTIPDITIAGNGFIVLASTTAAPNYPASFNVNGVTSFPALTNSGQTLILKTAQDKIISTVTFSDTWYKDNTKKEGGWSLEQIDPNNPCAGIENWKASISTDAGTPGSQNSVFASNPDLVSPQVVRVGVLANDTIQLYFTESIDSASLLNLTSYLIDNGIGNPIYAKPIAPAFKSVRLALATPLQNDVIYTITVASTISDCVGNLLNSFNSARFAIPKTAQYNDIVINEILADPNTGGYDFVELYNRSNKVIDLKTLTLSQYDTINNALTSIKTISTDGYLIFPSEYIVLSANGAAVRSQYYTSNPTGFLDLPSMITMNITGGTVCLARVDTIIDLLKYYDNMQFSLLQITKGVTLERIDFNRPTQDRTNWHSAAKDVGYGTPGYKNSQYNDAGETDDAIEVTPQLFSPDEDGNNDVVNINYHFDTPGFVANIIIYDSKGRMIRNLIRNELLGIKGTFSWDGTTDDKDKARIGIYIIFVEVFDINGNVKHYKKTCVVAGKF